MTYLYFLFGGIALGVLIVLLVFGWFTWDSNSGYEVAEDELWLNDPMEDDLK